MKKILKTTAVALAGTLAFALAACTDGDDGFIKEEPSFYKDMEAVPDPSVTAVWDFKTNFSKYTEKFGKQLTSSGEIPCDDDGKGAKLINVTYNDIKLDSSIMKVGRNGATLASFKEKSKDQFELTLEKNSNIQIYAKQGGKSNLESRLIVITKKDDDEPIVQRDNMPEGTIKDPTIIIKGAPAGAYTLYVNGVNIEKIDVRGAAEVTEIKGAKGLTFKDTSNAENCTVLKKVKLPTLDLEDMDGKKEAPSSSSVEWTIGKNSDGKAIAIIVTEVDDKGNEEQWLLPVVTGEAKVRARVGRFIAEFPMKVTGDNVTDFALFNGSDAVKEAKLEALAGRMEITAKRGADDMTKYVEWKSSAPDVAKVTDGVVTAMKKGEATITATWSYGQETPLVKEVKITVTETKTSIALLANANLPAAGTVIVWEELKDSDEKALKESKPAVLSAKNTSATYAVKDFKVADGWITKSITSNKDATDYPGILFAQASVGSPKGDKLVTFKIVITPAEGKTVKLTDIAASFRANKNKIKAISLGNLAFTSTTKEDKDWRDTRLNLTEPLEIAAETELEVALTYDEFTTGDHFSIGDIKLFFEEES